MIEALKSGKIIMWVDVYEEEEEIFFEDRSVLIHSGHGVARLLIFPNVIVTGHQAFFTREALENIAASSIDNVTRFERSRHWQSAGWLIPARPQQTQPVQDH